MSQGINVYSEVAKQATRLLDSAKGAPPRAVDPRLLVDFAIGAAVLGEGTRGATLAQVVEFIDYRQHLMMTVGEVAGAVARLEAKGILRHEGEKLDFPEDALKRFPRNRSGKLSVTRRDHKKWEQLILGE